MTIEIRVPALGESVKEATVGKWFKQPGEAVKADEPLVELETDKVTVEVPAPAAGVMGDIKVAPGETVSVGAILGMLREGGAGGAVAAVAKAAPAPALQLPCAHRDVHIQRVLVVVALADPQPAHAHHAGRRID